MGSSGAATVTAAACTAEAAPAATTAFWNPHTNMGRFDPAAAPVFARGDGAWLFDESGERYFDGTSALWFANVGHAHPAIAAAIAAQAGTLENFHTFVGTLHRPVLDLSALLERLSPIPEPKILLGSGGSDAVEIALKLVRRYWQVVGRGEKRVVLSREHGYHGLHAYGTSVVGDDDLRGGYGGDTLVPDVARIPDFDLPATRATIERIGPERIAAIIAEPIIGSGGVRLPPEGYLAGLRALADEYDILLVLDEVITGFGRTGHWFAAERYGVVPDLLTFAKGVTSGYVPLGGVFVGRRVWDPFFVRGDHTPVYWHGLTYSGHALASAAAIANLGIIESEGLLGQVADRSRYLAAALEREVAGLPAVAEVRVEGLLAGVQLADGRDAGPVVATLRDRFHQLVRPCGDVIALSPPFIASEPQLDALVADIAAVLQPSEAG